MFLTNHTLVGVALGLSLDDPLVIAPVAFGSHFVLDAVPHFGFKAPKKRVPLQANMRFLVVGAIDFTFSAIITITACTLRPERAFLILEGVVFAALPDLQFIPAILFGKPWPTWLHRLNKKVQWSETPAGGLVEIIFAGLLIWWLSHKL